MEARSIVTAAASRSCFGEACLDLDTQTSYRCYQIGCVCLRFQIIRAGSKPWSFRCFFVGYRHFSVQTMNLHLHRLQKIERHLEIHLPFRLNLHPASFEAQVFFSPHALCGTGLL